MRKSDYEIFLEKFKPIENPKEENLFMFETYGEQYQIVENHVKQKGDQYCWTVVDGEKSNLYLIPGWHFVNRLGYVLTTVPFEENQRDYKY